MCASFIERGELQNCQKYTDIIKQNENQRKTKNNKTKTWDTTRTRNVNAY